MKHNTKALEQGNTIIILDNFLQSSYLKELERIVEKGKIKRLDDTQNHVMSYTQYAWNIITCDLRHSEKRYPLLQKIDTILDCKVPKENLNPIQLFAKEFEADSFCAPHHEDPSLYGPWVFMLYLTNETDGALCAEGLKIIPRRNRFVVMRTGINHWVERCSGRRLNITGWSFASQEVVQRWKTPQNNPKSTPHP